jgi:hypothetical protein
MLLLLFNLTILKCTNNIKPWLSIPGLHFLETFKIDSTTESLNILVHQEAVRTPKKVGLGGLQQTPSHIVKKEERTMGSTILVPPKKQRSPADFAFGSMVA